MNGEALPLAVQVAGKFRDLRQQMDAESRNETALGSTILDLIQLQEQVQAIVESYRAQAREALTAGQIAALAPVDEAAGHARAIAQAARLNLVSLPETVADPAAAAMRRHGILSGPGLDIGSPAALQEALSLTDAQVDQLRDLNQALSAEVRPITQQVEAKIEDVREEARADVPNEAIVGTLSVEVSGMLAQLDAAIAKYREVATAILSDEQSAALEPISRAAQRFQELVEATHLNLVSSERHHGVYYAGRGLAETLRLASLLRHGASGDTDDTDGAQPPSDGSSDEGMLTQGLATETFACGNLPTRCSGTARRFFEARCGIVVADDGTRVQVPTVPATGPDPTDLYNDCTGTGHNPSYLDELELVSIDPTGEEVVGYVFGDNYYELYVNGSIVARDPVGFVPFNSGVVSFRAERPLTYAVKLVDWGTHLGVGMEYDSWNVGDGGFVASFGDGTTTGASWKCRAYYISPLEDASCVQPGPDSSACPERPPCAASSPTSCMALHYPVPEDWADPDFDDSAWPTASTYPASAVTNQRAYTDYLAEFGNADFIWSKNLDQDNLVLCRVTVE